jgi:hypothetical protein
LTTTEISVSAFERISAAGTVQVRHHLADEHRVVVTVDENLVNYLEVITRNNELNIGTRSGNYSFRFTEFLVDVYSPVLTGVSMSGSGTFRAADEIAVPRFEASVSGSGRIEGTIECKNFTGIISGSGRITIYGSSENSNITISGSGHFNGFEFHSQNATVNISGSGRANIDVENSLDARISGSGTIIYRGEPTINSNISGSGSVTRL